MLWPKGRERFLQAEHVLELRLARIGALWLPGWGGAGADAVVAQRMIGALGVALLLGMQASSTRGADGQLVARVASAVLRLLHAFSARLLCLAAPALFAAADIATASVPGAPSRTSLLPLGLKLLHANVAAQGANAVLCALLVALLRARSQGAAIVPPPPPPPAAVRVARPQLSTDGDDELEMEMEIRWRWRWRTRSWHRRSSRRCRCG